MTKIGDISNWAYMIQQKIEKNDPNATPWLSDIYQLADQIQNHANELESRIKDLAK
jgi:hypothetical protein